MHICVVGAGYIGAVMGAGLAELGHKVAYVELDKARVNAINSGRAPVEEPGLAPLFEKHSGSRLTASTGLDHTLDTASVVFIAVNTPSRNSGAVDLRQVVAASRAVGRGLRDVSSYPVVAVCSTVPPGTTENRVRPLLERESGKRAGVDFGLAMVPEFTAEGTALVNFTKPDRVIIGALDGHSMELLEALYAPLGAPIIKTTPRTAEMAKYAANCLLSTRISYANEIGGLCKRLGVDVYTVMDAVGLDRRLGRSFLNAGLGFGGPCLPKDLKALIHFAGEIAAPAPLLKAVQEVNRAQPHNALDLLKKHLGELQGKRVAVLGLAFKGGTSDIRGSRAIEVIGLLLAEGATVAAYDRDAREPMRAVYPQILYCNTAAEALSNADGCMILSEADEFKRLGHEFSSMRRPVVIDGRHILARRDGIIYEGLHW
ncbi:MAG: UDP-glucose/GDP-mannose dehydrogenase family protein [Chloroflexota bacterium]|nr:UDP-glucose/GDP-mannose dehydrogenase family protein [Chloroflexota bacterium]